MPTFVKTGYWDKLSKAPKGFLNLEELIASYVGSGLPGQVAFWGASGLSGSNAIAWNTTSNKLTVNNTASAINSAQLGFTNPVTILGDVQSPLRVLRNAGQPNIFIGTNNQVPNHSAFLFGIRTGAFYDTTAPKYSGDYAAWIVERGSDWGAATSASQLRINQYFTCNPNTSRRALFLLPHPLETSTNTDIVYLNNLYISTAGYFGTTPSARLHIRGDNNLASANSIYVENDGGTQLLNLNNTGQLLVGTGAFSTFKLDVNGDTRIKGSGTTSATTALTVQNSAGTDYLGVRNDGLLYSRGTNFWFSDQTAFSSVSNGSFLTGYRSSATGNYSFAANGGMAGIGGRNQALGNMSAVFGRQAIAYHTGQFSHSSFGFTLEGSSQHSFLQLIRDVTGTAITQLFIDGSTAQATLPVANSMWNAKIYVLAVCTTAGGTTVLGDVFSGEYLACIKRVGATTSMVGSISTDEKSNTSMSTSVVTIDADTATNALRIRFTPPTTSAAGTAIRVVATLHLTEVRY